MNMKTFDEKKFDRILCILCIKGEHKNDNKVKDVKLIKADETENNNMDKALLKNFELFGPPAILFFDKQSNEIRSHRLIGFFKSREFIEHVKQLKSL